MIGYALCGSFCTFADSYKALALLKEKYGDVVPIMSFNAYNTDTRFGAHTEWIDKIEKLCERKIINTISGAEPLGPKVSLDALVIAPCTGNTLAKLAHGITDTAVTMAAKAHLRNMRPLVIALSTNDALSANLGNIATLLSRKNVYFVPFGQDDAEKKPNSLSADFSSVEETVKLAMEGRQIQPLLIK
jgi:dipicolinate synthase subunit B